MNNESLHRLFLRAIAVTVALTVVGFLLHSKPTPPLKPVIKVAPAPSVPTAETSPVLWKMPRPKPLVGAWLHLRQAKIEPISFPGYRVRSTDTYDWLPDGRALLVRYAGGEKDHHELYAASSKSVRPLRHFNFKCSRKLYAYTYISAGDVVDHRPPTISAPACLLSPDGKNLLWLEDNYQHTSLDGMYDLPQIMTMAALDGTMRGEWNYAKVFPYRAGEDNDDRYFGRSSCWMRDGKHWLTLLIRDSEWQGFAVIDSRRSHTWRITQCPIGYRMGGTPLLGESRDGYILTPVDRSFDEGDHIMRFRPDARRPRAEYITVHLPLKGIQKGIYLSPKGDRLAWEIDLLYENGKYTKKALCFTTATGKFSSLSAPIEIPATIESDSLRWMPDGRHISFLKGDTLFKVALP